MERGHCLVYGDHNDHIRKSNMDLVIPILRLLLHLFFEWYAIKASYTGGYYATDKGHKLIKNYRALPKPFGNTIGDEIDV